MFLSPTNTIFMSNYLRFACCYPYSSHTCHSSHESHWSDVNSPFDWLARGAAVNLELVDQWWRWSPPWFTWNFKRNIWKRKRRTWKQERRVKDRKHTKNKNMSGKPDFVCDLKNFEFTFQFCAIYFLMCLHFWFTLIICRSLTAILKNFAFVFRFCALLFYTCFLFLFMLIIFRSVTAILLAGIWSHTCVLSLLWCEEGNVSAVVLGTFLCPPLCEWNRFNMTVLFIFCECIIVNIYLSF